MKQNNKYEKLFISTTDTIVGIGAPISIQNKEAIFELKKRPKNKQLIIMVDSIAMASTLKYWDNKALFYAKKFWPGNTTLVINKNLAIRIPNHVELRNLIKKIGPIYMTSANKSGKPFLNFKEAIKIFPEIKNHYFWEEGSNEPSTIIRISDGKVLR